MGSKAEPSDKRQDDCADERQNAWKAGLKAQYDAVANEPLPDRFRTLLELLDDTESR
jgi:hypothetical protein